MTDSSNNQSSIYPKSLEGFYECLRESGFVCHTQECLDANEYFLTLLNSSSTQKNGLNLELLKDGLAAIFAHNPEQQQQFYENFEEWWTKGWVANQSGATNVHGFQDRFRSRSLWGILFIAFCFIGVFVFSQELKTLCGEWCSSEPAATLNQSPSPTAAINTPTPSPSLQPAVTPSPSPVVSAEIHDKKDEDLILIGMKLQQMGLMKRLQERRQHIWQQWVKGFFISIFIVLVLLFLVWVVWNRQSRKKEGQQVPSHQEHYYKLLQDDWLGVNRNTVIHLAQQIQQRSEVVGYEFDIVNSIQDTVRSGLYPKAVVRPRQQEPTLLFLVESAVEIDEKKIDLWQAHIEHWIRALQGQGVNVLLYRYLSTNPLEQVYFVDSFHQGASNKGVSLDQLVESIEASGVIIAGSSQNVWQDQQYSDSLQKMAHWSTKYFIDADAFSSEGENARKALRHLGFACYESTVKGWQALGQQLDQENSSETLEFVSRRKALKKLRSRYKQVEELGASFTVNQQTETIIKKYFQCFIEYSDLNQSMSVELNDDTVEFAWVWFVSCSVYHTLRPDLCLYLGKCLADHYNLSSDELVSNIYWAFLTLPGFRQGQLSLNTRDSLHEVYEQNLEEYRQTITPKSSAKAVQQAFKDLINIAKHLPGTRYYEGVQLISYHHSLLRQWWSFVWHSGTEEDPFYAAFMHQDFDKDSIELLKKVKFRQKIRLKEVGNISRKLLMAVPVFSLWWAAYYQLDMHIKAPPSFFYSLQSFLERELGDDKDKLTENDFEVCGSGSEVIGWGYCLVKLGFYGFGDTLGSERTTQTKLENQGLWGVDKDIGHIGEVNDKKGVLEAYINFINNPSEQFNAEVNEKITQWFEQQENPKFQEMIRWFMLQYWIRVQNVQEVSTEKFKNWFLKKLNGARLSGDAEKVDPNLFPLGYWYFQEKKPSEVMDVFRERWNRNRDSLKNSYRHSFEIGELFLGIQPIVIDKIFRLGCQTNEASCPVDEQHSPEIKLENYSILRTTVTESQWSSYRSAVLSIPNYKEQMQLSNKPITLISWNELQSYKQWLNYQTGLNFELPSEAQWEYAAKLKNPKVFEYKAPFQEWVADCWHSNYKSMPSDGKPWLEDCPDESVKIVRGVVDKDLGLDHTQNRSFYRSMEKDLQLGFRLVLNEELSVKPTPLPTPNFPISKMISIKGGQYQMGCQPQDIECVENEKPLHEVSVPDFLLGQTEVTFEQYDYYCNQVSDCELPKDEGWGRGQRPVINVSWQDAQKYIQWLNAQDLPGGQYRLPSESEWEYAARAGTRTRYFWGNQPSGQHGNGNEGRGWPDDGYTDRTAPVGSYEANAWGLYDMSGNVWEWCEDLWNNDYQGAPDDGSAWVTGVEDWRVLRGGSWYYHPYNLRSGVRFNLSPSFRSGFDGFRLAQDHSL